MAAHRLMDFAKRHGVVLDPIEHSEESVSLDNIKQVFTEVTCNLVALDPLLHSD